MTNSEQASKCRVLIVDNVPDFLDRLERLLTKSRFRVRTATTPDEALQIIQKERFHVAVIDICLNKDQATNRDGLQLMRKLRLIDPSMGIIMTSMRLNPYIMRHILQPSLNEASVYDLSRTWALGYVEKKPKDLVQLPETVFNIIKNDLRINFDLRINDPERIIQTIAAQILLPEPRPSESEIALELDELIRKLFSRWREVHLLSIFPQRTGYSKAFVFQVIPRGDDGLGVKLIVKLGAEKLIAEEVRRYRRFIQFKTQNQLYPTVITPVCRTRSLGGIIYTFAGLTDIVRDLAEFFCNAEDGSALKPVMRRLFGGTLKLQHTGKFIPRREIDLRPTYQKMLRLKEDELRTQQDLLLEKYAVRSQSNPDKFWHNDPKAMTNPLYYAVTANFQATYVETTIHGDLHAHNVLVDSNEAAWLIDFADTCKGPRFQDFVALEASLMIEVNECEDIELVVRWAKSLFATPTNMFPLLPDDLAQVQALAKAHEVVLAIRREAHSQLDQSPDDTRAYLISLFFTVMRMTTVKFLSDKRRFHALVVASLVADNLIELEGSHAAHSASL